MMRIELYTTRSRKPRLVIAWGGPKNYYLPKWIFSYQNYSCDWSVRFLGLFFQWIKKADPTKLRVVYTGKLAAGKEKG